ncbi:MAG: histidine phosphatase family protein [Oscillibacter sp.]|nr:histidine phosphatase family protein [Oscillibacter sp.]
MKIYVTRHGETDWNVLKKACGSTDRPLTERGIRQAEELAERVRGKNIQVILSSPLERAYVTAQHAAEALGGLPVTKDARLMEIDYGEFEGIDRSLPEYRRVRNEPAMRYPGGESMFDVAARIYPFLDEVRATYAGKDVLLVCHGALARIIDTYFHSDWKMEDLLQWQFANCELVEYEV